MRTILITGANKGIGFETAKQLASQGDFVFISSRDKHNGIQAQQQLRAAGLANVTAITLDVTDLASIQNAARQVGEQVESLDILINNAGISGAPVQDFSHGDMEDIRRIYDTNFFGAIQTTQQFLPLLKKSSAASIINIASELGSLTMQTAPVRNANWANFHAYTTAKTALNAFTIMLAYELKNDKICVNSVTPGYTATDLNQFKGLKTAAQGAQAIVALANLEDRTITGKFFKEGGEVSW